MTRASDTARLVSGGAVFNEASNDVDFRVEGNGDANMLVVDAGNDRVGVGTNTPASTFHVSGDNPRARFTDTPNSVNFDIFMGDDNAVIGMQTNHVLKFMTNDSERMRLSTSGRLSINATDSTTASQANRVKIDCNNENIFGLGIESVRNSGGGGILITNNETSGSFDHIVFKASDDDTVGSVVATDSSTTYNTSSDYRLKENVSYNFDATTRLKKLKPARFNFKKDKDNTIDGFIAHEVSDIVPNAVNGAKDAVETYTDNDGKEQTRPVHQGIDHSKLVPLLTKSLQEALARIDTLEAEVAKLKG